MKLIADGVYKTAYDLSPEKLRQAGIRLIMSDLDNTLARYLERTPSPEILDWKKRLDEQGISLLIITNNRTKKVDQYCAALGVPFIKKAGKPEPGSLLRVLEQMGVEKHEALMLGDQIFTDVLAASRAGISALLVRPIGLGNPLRLLRYWLEQPFIRKAKKKYLRFEE